MKSNRSNWWHKWKGRIIPLVTVIAAFVASIMSMLGKLNMSVIFQSLTLSLLGLLALDALFERMGILEKILERLGPDEVAEPRLLLEEKLSIAGKIKQIESQQDKQLNLKMDF